MKNQNEPNRSASPTSSSRGGFESDDSSFVSTVIIFFLVFNTIIAAFRIRDDPYTLAFIFIFFGLLLLFFWSSDLYNRLPDSSPKKGPMKVFLWGLMTLLNSAFTYRLERFLDPAWSWVLWAVVAATSFTVFFLFFIYPLGVDAEEEAWSSETTYEEKLISIKITSF